MLQIAHYILKASNGEVTVDVVNRGVTFQDEQGRSVTIPLKSYQDGFNWYWNQPCKHCADGTLNRIVILEKQTVTLMCTNCSSQLHWEARARLRPFQTRK